MNPIDPTLQKIALLEQKINTLTDAVKNLSGRVALLERENNRRKSEVSQISNHIRKQ
jgi:outer membrane murein-binding lipoprotein Lpp